MKNTKSLFKIMAAFMSLVLVLGALFTLGAVSVGAAEGQDREIIPVPDLPAFCRPYRTIEELGFDFETIDAYFPQTIEVRYEDGKIYVEDIGGAYVSVSADKAYALELVDGYWTAELEAEPTFIYVYSYETYIYDKHVSANYNEDGIRDPYININDYVNSVYITFSLEYENVTIQYQSENYYYEDDYEDDVLDTHCVSNIQDPESVNDVFYGVDGKIRYCRLLTDNYYYYFPGQGWSDSWYNFNASNAPAGYEDKDETYFAANKPALICAKAKGDDIVHDMADATCTSPKTCKNGCGHTEGEALGHDMADATCTTPKTCTRGCGHTEGEALGHNMANATCTSPKTCKNGCGLTEGEALGHDMADATCTTPKTCKNGCGLTEGEALGHNMANATCTTPKTCTRGCGHTEGEALGHNMANATCTSPKTCKNGCGLTEGKALGHDMADADCTTPKTCKRGCGHTESEALGHNYGEWTSNGNNTHTRVCSRSNEHKETIDCSGGTATCTEQAVCETCKTVYGEAPGHDFADATCTTPKTCKACNATEGEALGHSYDNACDGDCNACGTSRTPANHVGTDEDDICDVCGTDIQKNGLSGGAIASIVIGGVAVLVLGGFAIIWFVIRKKRS